MGKLEERGKGFLIGVISAYLLALITSGNIIVLLILLFATAAVVIPNWGVTSVILKEFFSPTEDKPVVRRQPRNRIPQAIVSPPPTVGRIEQVQRSQHLSASSPGTKSAKKTSSRIKKTSSTASPVVGRKSSTSTPIKSRRASVSTTRKEPSKLPPPPIFPLIIKDISVNPPTDVVPNCRTAVPVNNEFFEGEVLIKLRTDPFDPWLVNYFENRRRTWEIQIQGKMKKLPRNNMLFMGAELPRPMNLGMLSKGLAKMVLKMLGRFSTLHSSFGDAEGVELPHSVFPIHQAMDRVIITPPGETPPVLGADMLPDTGDKAKWNDPSKKIQYEKDYIYSYSFHNMYLDLTLWKVRNLPAGTDLDCHNFFGDMPLRLVAYDLPDPNASTHVHTDKNYYFCFTLEHIIGQPVTFPKATSSPLATEAKEEEEEKSEEEEEEDTEEGADGGEQAESSSHESPPSSSPSRSLRGSTALSESSTEITSISVPAKVKTGSRKPSFLLQTTTPSGRWCTVRSWKEAHSLEKEINSKVGTEESGANFTAPSRDESQEDMEALLNLLLESTSDRPAKRDILLRFLHPRAAKLTTSNVLNSSNGLIGSEGTGEKVTETSETSGYVLRALWETCWVEEWCSMSGGLLSFSHSAKGKSKSELKIPLSDIQTVSPWPSENDTPPFETSFFSVATPAVVHIFSVSTNERRNTWVSTITRATQLVRGNDTLPAQFPSYSSPRWKSLKRLVLNSRSLVFGLTSPEDPLSFSAALLEEALGLSANSSQDEVCKFLDLVCQLKGMDLSKLSATQRVPFFVNVYHTLLIHSTLTVGSKKLSFLTASYEVTINQSGARDVLSLADIAHCILRGNASSVKVAPLGYTVPTLKQGDPRRVLSTQKPSKRLSLVLRDGAGCGPSTVPVISPSAPKDAIRKSVQHVLDGIVEVSESKPSVLLPKQLDTFKMDFGRGTKSEILSFVAKYLSEGEKKDSITRLLSEEAEKVEIKYTLYDKNQRHKAFTKE